MRKLAALGLGLILWAQSLPESDCINAIPVCQQTYTYTSSPPDFGQTQELANNTCLLKGLSWYRLWCIPVGAGRSS